MGKDCENRFGLIGYPIGHSLSPGLFNAAYHERFSYELIENKSFERAYSIFSESFRGINVTAPFKEIALSTAGICSDECLVIGAANILVKKHGVIYAYNSDFLAVKSIIQTIRKENRKILVIGCGGAGKAAAAAAVNLGKETTIINRTVGKAMEWAKRLETDKVCVKPAGDLANCIKNSDIIINTLPCNLPELDSIVTSDDYDNPIKGKTVIEANYRNPQLCGCITNRKLDINYISGHKWLLEQAASGYLKLTSDEPDYKSMCQYLSEFNLAGFKIND